MNFTESVIYCASLVVRIHDNPTIASTLLNESGVIDNPDAMRLVSDYDLAPLRDAGLIPPTIIGRE